MTPFLSKLQTALRAPFDRLPPVARACALMLTSTVLFATMHALIRTTSQHMPAVEVAFFRNLFGLVVLAPLMMSSPVSILKTNRFGQHVTRSVINVGSMLCFFIGLSMTPIARATALSFTAPLFTALFSALFLGEVFRWRRWTAIVVGFAGTLVILRPGLGTMTQGDLLLVVSAVLWSFALIEIKLLGKTESSLTITSYVTLLMTPMTLVPALFVWQTPSPELWIGLITIGVLGVLGQIAVTEALLLADTTVVMPFDFLKLIWATLFGIVLFGEMPDALTYVGAAMVFGSTFFIAWREARARGVTRRTKAGAERVDGEMAAPLADRSVAHGGREAT